MILHFCIPSNPNVFLANSNYAGPTQQADTGYGSPTEAPDEYGAPQADPVSSYNPPTQAPSYGAGNKAPKPYDKPVFVSDQWN